MIHFDALEFYSMCRSEEVMFLLKLSVIWRNACKPFRMDEGTVFM